MSMVHSQPWEVRLLVSAQEALETHGTNEHVRADDRVLEAAYRYCEQLTRHHSRTFYVASGLLPVEKRRAARALYAFCRVTDDIVDDARRTTDERIAAIDRWQHDVMSPDTRQESPVILAWRDTQARFNIPRGYAQQLIEGCRRDIDQTRYQTFDDLAEYSYGVASTVGLMAMHIIGFASDDAIPYAVKLGVALQVTNILRDVGEDWRNGRVYLPQDEMSAFGLSDEDIRRGSVDERWRDFMQFQIERNRTLYAESQPGIGLLKSDGRFAIAAAADLYQAILSDIERHDFDVFNRRAHIGALGKLSRLPGIWLRSRRAG